MRQKLWLKGSVVLDLVWLALAREDLLAIVDYISDDNPDAGTALIGTANVFLYQSALFVPIIGTAKEPLSGQPTQPLSGQPTYFFIKVRYLFYA
jgi:plasmid stabilization system protein ParE